MGSVAELKDAVKDALQRKGIMPQLQASVRSQIFSVLLASEDATRPELCDETLFINELIREYLVYNGLRDTLSVFLPESGQPAVRPFDRDFLAKKLKVEETPQSQQVPLLYALVARQQQLSAGGLTQQQRTAAGGNGSDSSKQQQQQQHVAPSSIPAARSLAPAGQQLQQALALNNVDAEFSEMHSISSVSQSTQAS